MSDMRHWSCNFSKTEGSPPSRVTEGFCVTKRWLRYLRTAHIQGKTSWQSTWPGLARFSSFLQIISFYENITYNNMVRLNKNQTMYAKKGMFYSSWNSVMRVLCCDVTGSGELFTSSQLPTPLVQTWFKPPYTKNQEQIHRRHDAFSFESLEIY